MNKVLRGTFFVSPDPLRERSGGAQAVGAVEKYDEGRLGGPIHPDRNDIEPCQVPRDVSATAGSRA